MFYTRTSRDLLHRVHHVREVSSSAFVLRLDRHGLNFLPGQYINLGRRGSIHLREYTIYSSVDDPFLEVLIKEVEEGFVQIVQKNSRRRGG